MRILISISLMLLLVSTGFAQPATTPKFTYNIDLALPAATSNEPFKNIMQGLVSTSMYGQYSFPFHFHVGVGVKYSYFAINEFSVPSKVYGGIHSGGAFVKLGYDKFHNNRFATDVSVKIGYTESFVSTDKNKAAGVNPVRISAPLIEPVFGLILTADERNSYRLNIGYGIQGYGFKPVSIGLESNEGYDETKFDNLTQYFLIGFGYTYYFGVKGGGE